MKIFGPPWGPMLAVHEARCSVHRLFNELCVCCAEDLQCRLTHNRLAWEGWKRGALMRPTLPGTLRQQSPPGPVASDAPLDQAAGPSSSDRGR